MKKIRIISLILCFVLLISAFGMNAFADNEHGSVQSSGFCGAEGQGLEWRIYSDGTLIISGNGKMADYMNTEKDRSVAPWRGNFGMINYIIVEDGVKSIGAGAFYYSSGSMIRISLPESIESIGYSAFYPQSRPYYGRKIAVCYAGSEEKWKKIETDRSNLIALETGRYILCFNGEEPAPFCKICTSLPGSGAIQYKNFTVYAEYYLGGHCNADFEWDLGKNYDKGRSVGGSGTSSTFGMKEGYFGKPGEENVRLCLVDPDGTVISQDETVIHVNSAPLKERLENFAGRIGIAMFIPVAMLMALIFGC